MNEVEQEHSRTQKKKKTENDDFKLDKPEQYDRRQNLEQ